MERVAIVRASNYNPTSVDKALSEALKLLGGWESFVQPSESIVLKPNLIMACAPDELATTHPQVVEAVVRQLQAQGAKPCIGESPAFGSIKAVAKTTGMQAVADATGIPIYEFNQPVKFPIKTDITPKGITGDRLITQSDGVINVPKLKAHTQAKLTGCVKNLYGCVPGKRKAWWHFKAKSSLEDFADMLVENARAIGPMLNVVDAITAMERRGPRGGDAKPMGLLVVGRDPVAVDAVLVHLVGVEPDGYEVLNAARRRGVGTPDLEHIEVVGLPLEEARDPSFKLPEQLDDISFKPTRVAKSVAKQVWLRQVKERTHA